ncbi:MAG: hypothetical protein OEX11_00450 [Nitrosomonas sp.]|nr:hypothetical protein [Nitrosomonas sp.]
MKQLFTYLQILTITFPIIIFSAYIIMDEGDQFTDEHYLITSLSAIPFFIVLLVKFLMSDADKE